MSATIPKSDQTATPPNAVEPLLAREDEFYFEGQFMVFTEAYHLRRGYCCNSDCRHCPYK